MSNSKANYYAELLDLEELDPERAMIASGRECEWSTIAKLFALDALDLVNALMERGAWSSEVAAIIAAAMRAKEAVFEGIADSSELVRTSPRHLAERELAMWAPRRQASIRSLMKVELPVRLDWKRRGVDVDDAASVTEFYRRTESYIFELMAANSLVQTLYNYDLTLNRMERLGVDAFLDYGAGIGTFVLAGLRRGLVSTHMDLPSRTLEFARWRYSKRGLDVPVIMASGSHSDIPAAQCIVCTEVIEHVPDPLALLDALTSALPRGGCLLSRSRVATLRSSLAICRPIAGLAEVGSAMSWRGAVSRRWSVARLFIHGSSRSGMAGLLGDVEVDVPEFGRSA